MICDRVGCLSPKPYVLVVDNFPDGREMVAEYLAFRGFAVLQAPTGSEALELARKELPRIILMDLSMPGIDGWEATRQLKADPRTRAGIVIALTAHALAPDEQKARDAGCDGFVAKPFDLSSLADGLERVMVEGRRALAGLSKISKAAKKRPKSDKRGHRREPTTTTGSSRS